MKWNIFWLVVYGLFAAANVHNVWVWTHSTEPELVRQVFINASAWSGFIFFALFGWKLREVTGGK